jgi:hypothetical protein
MFVSSTGENGKVKYYHSELDISKNSGKPYKHTNFDKEDIMANHKSFMSSLNIPINEENCELSNLYWIPKYNVYLFEIKHVCKLNWRKRQSEVLSFSVRRLLSITLRRTTIIL